MGSEPLWGEFERAGTLRLVEEADEYGTRDVPWALLLLTALVLSSAAFAVSPVTSSPNGAVVPGAKLALSPWYLLLAPWCDSLDTLSMFSLRQHFAFLITGALMYTGWRVTRPYGSRLAVASVRREAARAGLALTLMVALYAAGCVLPRPTARLAMGSVDAIVVDFHSHTNASWDGRAGFTPEENRRWHSASGFDVAYITDHGTFAGAAAAAAGNPARAGEGTVLLSGIEVRSRGRHLDVLGTSAADSAAYRSGDLQERVFLEGVQAAETVRPLVLLTLPGSIDPRGSAIPIDAIELSDGAPRGLAQIDVQRAELMALATTENLATVAGSNNHGWASATPAWSVLEIPGWRLMSPQRLDAAIRTEILERGFNAVSMVARRPRGFTSSLGTAWTVPGAIWQMLTVLSWPERASWVGWIWASYLLSTVWRFSRDLNARRGLTCSLTQDTAEINT